MMLWENNDIFHDNPLLLTEQRDHQTIGVAHPTQQFDVNVNVLCHASSNQTARCIPEYQGEFVLRSAASRPATGGDRLAGSRHTPGGSAYSILQLDAPLLHPALASGLRGEPCEKDHALISSAAVGVLPPWLQSDLPRESRSFITDDEWDLACALLAVVAVGFPTIFALSVNLFRVVE